MYSSSTGLLRITRQDLSLITKEGHHISEYDFESVGSQISAWLCLYNSGSVCTSTYPNSSPGTDKYAFFSIFSFDYFTFLFQIVFHYVVSIGLELTT